MPILPNVRHERFARAWLKTQNATQSYIRAGYNTTNNNSARASACRLLTHAAIVSRVKELRRMTLKRSDISVDSLLNDLAEDRQMARKLGQPSAAMKGTELIAKLVGLLIERKESGKPGEFDGLETVADVLAKAAKDLGPDVAASLGLLLSAGSRSEDKPN